jgi:hypothetical protein
MRMISTCWRSSGSLPRNSPTATGAGGGYGFSPISEAAGRLEADLREGAEAGVIKDDLTLLCEVLRAVVVPEAD